MSQNLPSWGKDLDKDDADLLPEDIGHEATTGTGATIPERSSSQPNRWPRKPKWSPPSHADLAITDAQQSLSVLLNPDTGTDSQPHVISPNGATRNNTRGRVAGPLRPQLPSHDAPGGYLTTGSLDDTGPIRALAMSETGLTTPPTPSGNVRDTKPQTRLSKSLSKATDQYRVIRERTDILVGAPGTAFGADAATVDYARRSAAQWATRYAMHAVIVVVVGALVALGGLRTLTAQSAFDGSLRAAGLETEMAAVDPDDFNSPDYEITLPRTELNSADLATNIDTPTSPPPGVAELVTRHTVVEGDTIQTVAAAHRVLPETVLGSNGLYDADEPLKTGSTLIIPPVDGMYYVTAEGDTLESLAKRFSVDPKVITGYASNILSSGQVVAGQPLLVPGGMMPQRYEVLVYTVSPGDSLRDIASRYGIDVPTLIVSNDIPDPDNLRIDAELRILPMAGAEYKVKEGDTLQSIATRLGVTADSIAGYEANRIALDAPLQVGQALMVPGAKVEWESRYAGAIRQQPSARDNVRPAPQQVAVSKPKVVAETKPPVKKEVKPPAPKATPKPAPKKSTNTPQVGTGRMVWPVRGTITQYFSGRHNGLDIAIRAGTPLVAADAGKVIWSGWRQDGLGYCVMIDHGNGLTTIYGHMIRQPPVYVGQYVARGERIGNIGSTGRSTGPHVHFMVKSGGGASYRNPLVYLGK